MIKEDTALISVEIVYGAESSQYVESLKVPVGTQVMEAIELSSLFEQYPNLEILKIGIYGTVVEPTTVLQPLDRIEIYRPLRVDAKEARRRRAQKKQAMKKAQN